MALDPREIVTPGFTPGVHLQGTMDGRACDRKTRFALSPGYDS
ncbi:hypothetical protein AFEL58S_03799 [Afipia felis]